MLLKRSLTLAIAAASSLSYANTGDDQLEHIIVSSTRSEQTSLQLPASIQLISAEEIKLSGANNLSQVLNSQPGIQINDSIGNQGRGASISMRGFGDNNANNVLIMIDGRKLNNPTLATPDLSSVALADIERIEIIQGSAGALFGDQATGGVINIITKQPDEFKANIEGGTGSYNKQQVRAAIAQGFDNGLSYHLSAESKQADNYRKNNENEQSLFLGKVNYQQEGFSVFAEAGSNKDDLQVPGSLSKAEKEQDRRQASSFYPNDFSNRDTRHYRVGGDLNINENWTLLGEYTDTDAKSDSVLYNTPYQSSTAIKSFEPRISGTIDLDHGPIVITTGLDFKDSEYEFLSWGTHVEQSNSDIYGQAIIPVSRALSVTVGGRKSELKVDNKAFKSFHKDDVTVFQAGASYELSDSSRLFLRRDEGFRWPNIDENALTAPGVAFLKPQKNASWEFGVETNINQLSLSAVIYNLELQDEILYDPTVEVPGSMFSGANINVDESTRKGLVLNSNLLLSEQLKLSLNYSYVDAEITSGTFKGNTAPYVADSTANLSLNYAFNQQWTFYADAQYTGARYMASDHGNTGDKLPAHTLLNANVRWDNNSFYGQLRLNNILGKEYDGYAGGNAFYSYHYPAPTETFQLSLGYSF